MTQYVCPCLNVRLFCVKGQRGPQENLTDVGGVPLSSVDPFFSQALYQLTLDKQGIVTSQANLLSNRMVGQWTINTCLCCKQDTHATLPAKDSIFISPQALLNDPSHIKSLLQCENYSEPFQLVLPRDNQVSPVADKNTPIKSCQLKTVIQSIRQQAANFLLQEQKEMEERVRAYTDQQYLAYDSLQSKVTRERQSLMELVTRICQQHQQKGNLKMVLPSPFDHFPSPPTSPDNSGSTSSNDLTFDRHDSKEENLPNTVMRVSHRLPVNQRTSRNRQATRNSYQLSKSVDVNAIFDMDGIDDEDGAAFPFSDDEEDTDDSTTEEPHSTNNAFAHHKYSSSVPITVPLLTAFSRSNGVQENPTPDDPNQIAASIQALALSMRDDKEMFGDLPRRRLNTGDLVKSRPIF